MRTTFTFGDIRIDRVVELECPIRPARVFLPSLTQDMLDENRHWLRPDALDAQDWLVLCFQSYVIRTPRHTILVDTCIGNDKDRVSLHPRFHRKSDGAYMRALAQAGLGVEYIDLVLCTHLHVDHVGWNTRLQDGRWAPTFPSARYLFSETEFRFWEERNARAPVLPFADSVLPVVEAGRHSFVRSDVALDDHVRLLPTPGHTPDHFSVLFGKGRDDGVITGDLIHSPLQARHPELWMKDDVDPDAATVTRRAFLERFCETGTVCCASHFPSPSLTRIGRWGDGFRCDPVGD
jgi:glyoxylase-like metal-dependent hydrolase (beta-lactamase superfamily II)